MSFIRDKKIRNGTYRYRVETYYVNGKPRQKILEYLGKVVQEGQTEKVIKPRNSLSAVEVECVRPYGDVSLIHTLTEEAGLVDSIDNVCPGIDAGKAVSLLVINRILGRKPLQKIANWYSNSCLNPTLGCPSSFSKDKLLGAMDKLCDFDANGNRIDFTPALQKHLWGKQKKSLKTVGEGLYYDITPIIVYGIENALFRNGRKTLGKSYREFHAGLVIDRKSMLPVLLKTFRGNMSDMQTISEILSELKEAGIEKSYITTDRGMKSTLNIEKLLNLGVNIIMGVPSSHKESKIIYEVEDSQLLKVENRIQRRSGYSYVLGKTQTFDGRKYNVVLCLNPKLREVQRENRHQNISDAKTELEKLNKDCGAWNRKHIIQKINALSSGLKAYIHCTVKKVEGKNKIFIKIDQQKLTEKLISDGKFVILSSDLSLSAREVFLAYFQKDEIEKAFRTFKGELDFTPTRHYLEKRVISHNMIGYMTYLIHSILRLKLQKAKIDMSPAKCLEKLEEIKEVVIKQGDQTTKRLSTVTKEQKQILSKLGLSRLIEISA